MTRRTLILRPQNAMLTLLILWLIVSAFYYAEYLFAPRGQLGYDEGTTHKALKYFICLVFSAYFCLKARAYSLMLFCSAWLMLAAALTFFQGSLEIAAVSIIAASTMLPFMLIPSIWPSKILAIGRTVTLTGAVIGILSAVEVTLLSELFESAWASTGSVRSISTLLNPNNLGLYAGVALILLPFMKFGGVTTAICGSLIAFSLLASGSRTAWVSLPLTLLWAMFSNKSFRMSLFKALQRHFLKLLAAGIALALAVILYRITSAAPDIEITHRGTDLYTASIRLENFLTFVSMIDGWILYPDIQALRDSYIQDNFYLVVVNSFGLIGAVAFVTFLFTHLSPKREESTDLLPWKLVFIFFMISGLSGSQLNSFPNNQLFFLSMGAFWAYRHQLRRRRESAGLSHDRLA